MTVLTDRVLKLARDNYDQGVLNEPRMYYDVITPEAIRTEGGDAFLPSGKGAPSYGDPDAFVNKEQYPVWLTHMTATPVAKTWEDEKFDPDGPGLPDEGEASTGPLAGIGLQWRPHSDYYMKQNTFASLAQWQNVNNGYDRNVAVHPPLHLQRQGHAACGRGPELRSVDHTLHGSELRRGGQLHRDGTTLGQALLLRSAWDV
jgi:hypothetical protein